MLSEKDRHRLSLRLKNVRCVEGIVVPSEIGRIRIHTRIIAILRKKVQSKDTISKVDMELIALKHCNKKNNNSKTCDRSRPPNSKLPKTRKANFCSIWSLPLSSTLSRSPDNASDGLCFKVRRLHNKNEFSVIDAHSSRARFTKVLAVVLKRSISSF